MNPIKARGKTTARTLISSLRKGWLLCLALGLYSLGNQALAQAEQAPDSQRAHAAQLEIQGAIGPATTDYLLRSMAKASAAGAEVLVLRIDTPGGLSEAMRDIIKEILASPLPVVSYVHPAGARAASAGTYILYASHVAAMAPATTLGAATPVQIGAPGLGQPAEDQAGEESDGTEDTSGGAMERKMVNDAVAFIRGLAARHGRNAEWAERAVREAVSLTAEEALAQQVIDLVATDVADLLTQIDGREVRMADGSQTLRTANLPIVQYAPDWRNKLLAVITNPQVAYILLLIGIYGLIFEGYNPGALVPGVVGIICLLVAFYALQLLPVNYVGLALIVLGVILMLSEAFMPSFGVLGIGGVAALVIGSVMLIDPDVPGFGVSRQLIGAIGLSSGLLVLGILVMAGRSLRIKRPGAEQAFTGRLTAVLEAQGRHSRARIDDVWWHIESATELQQGQQVRVVGRKGLKLQVESAGQQAASNPASGNTVVANPASINQEETSHD